jgi:nicotinamide phosphoribosyltransferase
MKATYCEVNGEGRAIFKAPKTDSKKNSAKGLLFIGKLHGRPVLYDNVEPKVEASEANELKLVFENGKLLVDQTLAEIRGRVAAELAN